ncbi:unnamed protein product [Closterium sp. Naga37s-1]|nr:unnamed protein product [Closterium sp. Naga37s-1]
MGFRGWCLVEWEGMQEEEEGVEGEEEEKEQGEGEREKEEGLKDPSVLPMQLVASCRRIYVLSCRRLNRRDLSAVATTLAPLFFLAGHFAAAAAASLAAGHFAAAATVPTRRGAFRRRRHCSHSPRGISPPPPLLPLAAGHFASAATTPLAAGHFAAAATAPTRRGAFRRRRHCSHSPRGISPPPPLLPLAAGHFAAAATAPTRRGAFRLRHHCSHSPRGISPPPPLLHSPRGISPPPPLLPLAAGHFAAAATAPTRRGAFRLRRLYSLAAGNLPPPLPLLAARHFAAAAPTLPRRQALSYCLISSSPPLPRPFPPLPLLPPTVSSPAASLILSLLSASPATLLLPILSHNFNTLSIDRLELAPDQSAINWYSYTGSMRRLLGVIHIPNTSSTLLDLVLRHAAALPPTPPMSPGSAPTLPPDPGPEPDEPDLPAASTGPVRQAADEAAYDLERRRFLTLRADHRAAREQYDMRQAAIINHRTMADRYTLALAEYTAKAAAWKESDLSASNIILGGLPPALMRDFQEQELHAPALWASLHAMFERHDVNSVGLLLDEYWETTLATCTGAVAYTGRMTSLAKRLKARQSELPQFIQIDRLLRGLNPSYDMHVIAFRENQPHAVVGVVVVAVADVEVGVVAAVVVDVVAPLVDALLLARAALEEVDVV